MMSSMNEGSLEDGRRDRRRERLPRRTVRRTVEILPTLLTLGNLLCGFLAIFFASRTMETELLWDWTPLTFAAVFIFFGMIFDGLDGHVARITDNTSDLGEQLDSMADMVSFGVAPALLAVKLAGVETPFVSELGDDWFGRIAVVTAGLYVACAGLRLARFNLQLLADEGAEEEAKHRDFAGLPSPGAAGTVAGIVLVHQNLTRMLPGEHWASAGVALLMVGVLGLAALAMVSRLRYAHVVNRYLRGHARFEYVVAVVGIGLLVAINVQAVLAVGFLLYALSAPARWVRWRLGGGSKAPDALTPIVPEEEA